MEESHPDYCRQELMHFLLVDMEIDPDCVKEKMRNNTNKKI